MTRSRGRDSTAPKRGERGRERPREVYVYTEGERTEIDYIELVHEHGNPADPRQRVHVTFRNDTAPTSRRKPLPLVEEAVAFLPKAHRAARNAGIEEKAWNWPQVWCLFERDQHERIPTAFARAREAGVRIAYSHPCFELWRLLHYQNYTSTFGGVCNDAANRLMGQPGFAQTYGERITRVPPELAKRVRWGQIEQRFTTARKFAERLNAEYAGRPDETAPAWDPYTDVYTFVKKGLLLKDY
jgi:RloB-like protein